VPLPSYAGQRPQIASGHSREAIGGGVRRPGRGSERDVRRQAGESPAVDHGPAGARGDAAVSRRGGGVIHFVVWLSEVYALSVGFVGVIEVIAWLGR